MNKKLFFGINRFYFSMYFQLIFQLFYAFQIIRFVKPSKIPFCFPFNFFVRLKTFTTHPSLEVWEKMIVAGGQVWRIRQWSQNVGAGGPHHRSRQLMASSSLDCHRLDEWGRHNELEASMVGAASSHVLGSLEYGGCGSDSKTNSCFFACAMFGVKWCIIIMNKDFFFFKCGHFFQTSSTNRSSNSAHNMLQ